MTPTELKARFPNASRSTLLRNPGEGDKDALALAKEFVAGGTVAPTGMSPAGVMVPAPDAVEEEAQLHYDILDWCRANGWVALHGTMTKATGRTIGELDFTLVGPGRVLFIECKDRDGKLSVAQQAMIAHLTKLGHKPAVVRSMREFLEIVTNNP